MSDTNKINDAWLNLGPDLNEDLLFNPMEFVYDKCEGDITKIDKYLSLLMTKPEYFSFVCKYIFNVQISPLQAVLLADMWNRKFPMLIGSRGLSKALEPECPVLTPNGWVPIKDLKMGDIVYGSDGKKTKVISVTDRQKNLKFYKITLRDGRTINACEDHMWKVWSKNKNKKSDQDNPVWSEMKTSEMADCFYYDRKDSKSKTPKRTKEYLFALPVAEAVDFPEADLKIHPYVLGVLLGDGSITTNTISFTSGDLEIADRVSELLPNGYKLSETKRANHSVYYISRSDKSIKPFRYLLSDLGLLGRCSHDKFIPTSYLFSSIKQRTELLKGLMDTDGTASNGSASYTTVSKKLSDGFLDLARSLGIHCKEKCYKTFCNGRRYADHYVTQIYTDKHIFSLNRKNDQINKNKSKAGKSKYQKVFITNIEEISNRDGHCIQVDNADHTYITKDFIVTHNSFTLSLYSMLRAFLLPQRKIVVVGAAFRQSKVLYDYCDTIWKNAPVLRDICDSNSGLTRDVDRCQVKINDGTVVFLPLGDGCLTANTSVMYGDRFGLLGDLFDLKYKDEMDIPNFSRLLLYDGQNFRNSPHRRYNGLKQTIKITTELGYEIEGTLDHKMMSFSGWKKLKDFRIGDLLEINLSGDWHSGWSNLTENEAYQMGINLREEIPKPILSSPKRVVQSFLRGVFHEGVYTFFGRGEEMGMVLMNIISRFGQLSQIKNGKISLIEGGPPSGQPYYDKVVRIEHRENYTYDVEVDVSHKYLANSMISHNSKIRGQRAHDIINDEMACLRANTLVQTDYGLLEIRDYLDGEAYSLLNKDSQFEYPTQIFRTPKTDVYRIETRYGYSFECSELHKVLTQDGWKIAKDLVPGRDRLQIDCNDYFPSRYISKNGVTLDENHGWVLGLLISEGTVTNRNYFSIANTDKNLIDLIVKKTNHIFNWKVYHKKAYTDNRGWDCKESWSVQCNNTELRDAYRDFGLGYNTAIHKTIPKDILLSPKSVVLNFLAGMFEGDGTAFYCNNRGKQEFQVALYSSSKRLLEVTQILLLKFGIFSGISARDVGTENINYRLTTRGEMACKLFNVLNGMVEKWKDIEAVGHKSERKPSIRKSNNGEKFYVSTTYGNKNIYIGGADTEEECLKLFEEFWKDKRELLIVTSVEKLPEQEVLYDFYLPQTHSFIGNGFIQHNSTPKEIFENVVAGFAAVASSPIEKMKKRAAEKMAAELGIELERDDSAQLDFYKSNQIILSGTAYYDFNHFADYWKRYCAIIKSGGDPHKLAEVFGGEVPGDFNWKDYAVYRIPVDLLPPGYMDEGQIARSKATVHSGIFDMEYGAVFSTDSKGFFKRSLIESCVCSEKKPIVLPSGEVFFSATTRGNTQSKYIIGVDPASEEDNFSIVVLEIMPDHRRVVYAWTTTRERYRESFKANITNEDNFYGYCARKIRDLMKTFPTVEIALDSQGGGVAVMEALHDRDKLQAGELAIWPTIDPDKPAETDGEPGLHILKLCKFVDSMWTAEANHGLRKDLEDKVLIFPFFDSATLGFSLEDDKKSNRTSDTLEDCVIEIEQLKDELALIVLTQTASGREKWDTPHGGFSSKTKSKLRKDRYSALLMANDSARRMLVERTGIEYDEDYCRTVGFAERFVSKESGRDNYHGPAWFIEGAKDLY